MATTVTIVSVEGPFVQKENPSGSAVVTTVTRWVATAKLPDGRLVSASWTAPTYVSADANTAIGAAVNALLASQNPDTGKAIIV